MRHALLACVTLLIAPPAAAQCVLSGRATIERVVVRPAGGPPVRLALEGYEATVVPRADGRARVESATTLVWAGIARARDIEVWLSRELSVADGAIRIHSGAPVGLPTMSARGDPTVDVELDDGVFARALRAPCDALSLEEPGLEERPDDGPTEGEAVPLTGALSIHARPGGPSVRLDVRAPSSFLLARVERRGGWVRVRRDLEYARVEGWVLAADLRAVRLRR